jgi:hypothetical protein
MPDYRCHHLNSSGHIVNVQLFGASSDVEACARGDEIVATLKWHRMELWELGRKISCPENQPVTTDHEFRDEFVAHQ